MYDLQKKSCRQLNEDNGYIIDSNLHDSEIEAISGVILQMKEIGVPKCNTNSSIFPLINSPNNYEYDGEYYDYYSEEGEPQFITILEENNITLHVIDIKDGQQEHDNFCLDKGYFGVSIFLKPFS